MEIPRIDPEFKSLIPPLSAEEFAQLEANIAAAGKCRDALVLWNGVIIDGHNRFEICMKHGIEFEVTEMRFVSRDAARLWIIENQLGRRNLTDAVRIELASGKTELLRKRAKANLSRGGQRTAKKNQPLLQVAKADEAAYGAALRPFDFESDGTENGSESDVGRDRFTDGSDTAEPGSVSVNVRKAVAEAAGVSEETVRRYMRIKEMGGPELLEQVRKGELKIGAAHRRLQVETTTVTPLIKEKDAPKLGTEGLRKTVRRQLKLIGKMVAYLEANVPDASAAEIDRDGKLLRQLDEQVEALGWLRRKLAGEQGKARE